MKIIIFTFVLLSTIYSNDSFAKKIKLAYVEFPPYEFRQGKKPTGILVDIVKEVFKKIDIPIELHYRPFKRGLEDVKKGSLDGIFNFYKIKSRLPFFDYSEPIIKNPLVFFVQRNSYIKFTSLKDLKGLKIGAMRGYTYGPEFDNNKLFKRDFVNSHKSNFIKLYYGRIDAYPCDKLVGIHVASENKVLDNFKILQTPLKVMDGHIGFTKNKHLPLLKKINNVIIEMKANGKIDKIIDNYIEKSFNRQKKIR